MRTAALAKTRQSGPIPIEHLRLAYEMEPKGSPEAQRIKEMNAALKKAAEAQIAEMNKGRNPSDHHGKPDATTRLTAYRLRSSPLALLLNEKRIGGEEMTAAQDLELAFMALSGSIGFKPLNMERVQGGQHPDWSDKTMRAVARYKAFADHWSMRKKRGDPTFEILIRAIIDQHTFKTIDADVGLRKGKAQIVVIRALRDYAARAGWCDKRQAVTWMAEAGSSFKLVPVNN